jgi:hypothetical protein
MEPFCALASAVLPCISQPLSVSPANDMSRHPRSKLNPATPAHVLAFSCKRGVREATRSVRYTLRASRISPWRIGAKSIGRAATDESTRVASGNCMWLAGRASHSHSHLHLLGYSDACHPIRQPDGNHTPIHQIFVVVFNLPRCQHCRGIPNSIGVTITLPERYLCHVSPSQDQERVHDGHVYFLGKDRMFVPPDFTSTSHTRPSPSKRQAKLPPATP